MSEWIGKGGGRSATQPTIQPAAGSDGTWVGKGGGRSSNQPTLQPADGSNGTWIGRGGGRSPNQPVITPASLVQAQKMLLNGAGSALQSIAGASGVGIPMAARELEDPIGGFVFALEVQGGVFYYIIFGEEASESPACAWILYAKTCYIIMSIIGGLFSICATTPLW